MSTATASTFAQRERAELCAVLDRVGPEAPTLCAGWVTRDLAAHLALRERRPDAVPGALLAPLAGYTAHVQHRYAARPWAELVTLLRNGPPPWSPMAPRRIDAAVNAFEFFVHHEDVRRAMPEWQPRELDAAAEEDLWRRLRRTARMLLRNSPVGVVLRRHDGVLWRARQGSTYVTLTGRPAELVLYAFGRGTHARVDLRGDDADVERFRTARLSL